MVARATITVPRIALTWATQYDVGFLNCFNVFISCLEQPNDQRERPRLRGTLNAPVGISILWF
jgi:hypothetical protein